jgi:hypothetical protein
MIELIDKPGFHAQDVRDGFVSLATGIVDLETQLAALSEAVSKKPEAFDPIIDPIVGEIASLKAGLQTLVTAIRGIKLPEVSIPEFPEIPTTDLAPIQSELAEIKRIVSTPEVREEKGEVAKTRAWTFDVKRGPGGYIREIKAREE